MDERKPTLTAMTYDGPEVFDQSNAPEPVQAGLERYSLRNLGEDRSRRDDKEAIPVTQASHPRKRAGLPPLALWLGIAVILVLIAAVAIAGGIGGTEIQHQKAELRTCQRQLNNLPAPNTNSSTSSSSNNVTIPGETYHSTCSSLQSWRSNLTELNYTQVCNADIGHYEARFTLVAGAIVDSFDACITMCDAFNWNWANNISVVAWSWSGNSSSGIQANPDGKCWCVQTYNQGYSMNTTLGIDCFLRDGSFDSRTIGTVTSSS